jgi:hypothetical protein
MKEPVSAQKDRVGICGLTVDSLMLLLNEEGPS